MHDVRKLCLWGNLMAGGAGVEYYFGYKLPKTTSPVKTFAAATSAGTIAASPRLLLDELIPLPI